MGYGSLSQKRKKKETIYTKKSAHYLKNVFIFYEFKRLLLGVGAF
jgi:hypothetical protein